MQVTLQKNLYTTKSEILVQTLEDLWQQVLFKTMDDIHSYI